ncbi:hypothetical protein BDQ17DRAFT_1431978 [Cyathus striatus]|nr:hypothetical protein BDQ17DRAFT_1431978 [Cyathus striatus]
MPRTTDHQKQEKALIEAFMINAVAEEEARLSMPSPDSSSSSEDSDSCSSLDSSNVSMSTDDSEGPFFELDDFPEHLVTALEELYSQCYLNQHCKIPKTLENVWILLNDHKENSPDIFHSYTGLTSKCFDSLVDIMQNHPAFQNNSNNTQMPIDHQLVIALFQFHHYGNAASVMKVALWAGVSYGTV